MNEPINIAGIIGYYSIPFLFVTFFVFVIYKSIFKKKKTLDQIQEEEKLKDIKSFDRAKKQWKFVKNYYRHIYFLGFILVFLFPPHTRGRDIIKFEFLLGSNNPINFTTFLSIIIGYVLIGVAFYFLFIKKRNES